MPLLWMRVDVTFPNEFMILYVLLKVKAVLDKLYILFFFARILFILPTFTKS
jgi:hypothetical protein